MNTVAVRRVARVVAIAIAISALIDPAFAARRAVKPDIAIVAADPVRDSVRADAVGRALGSSFNAVRAPFGNAVGTVIVGDRVPTAREGMPSPVFAATGASGGSSAPVVRIEALRVPAHASLAARVPVSVLVHARATNAQTVDVELRAGPLVVERTTRTMRGDDERIPLTLSYVSPKIGAAALRVVARVHGAKAADSADAVVDVRDERWRVLFFDPRPSWTSTFIRRVLDRDSRFLVTSRTATSRGVSSEVGAAPAQLDDSSVASRFDAIVVGAPDALSARDVSGLEAFARHRGGSVIVLLDNAPRAGASEAWTRLTGAESWQSTVNDSAASIAATLDSAALRGSEFARPTALPPAATTLAYLVAPGGGRDSIPVVWRVPLGLGEVIVNGAVDAWRSRDASQSRFDRFWTATIADAARAAVPPVDVDVASAMLTPGARTTITVTVRDSTAFANRRVSDGGFFAVVRPVDAAVAADAMSAIDTTPRRGVAIDSVRLWPGETENTLTGILRAPLAPGVYRVSVTMGLVAADAPIVVDPTALYAHADESDLLRAWVAVHGGKVVDDAHETSLAPALLAAVQAPSRVTIWHPFRSAWWVLPFALALAADWWLRRRAGLP